MAKNLVIVESPAKSKTIGRFLGKSYKIEASVGHIRDLPKSTLGVDVDKNFEPKYITIRGKSEVISKLKKEAKEADKVYLATDPDREGEAISWHLAALLDMDEKALSRITFNEITEEAVKKAMKSPRAIDMDLVDAQQARRVLDRIVGYKLSPLLWKKVRKGLSAGRVQSVAAKMVCDREDEITGFVPEEYWDITALLSSGGDKPGGKENFVAKYHGTSGKKVRLRSKEQVDEILKDLENSLYKVLKVVKGRKKKAPAPPFTTSTLQQEASWRSGFTTKKTMMVAQQLYEGIEIKGKGATGLVTYIRTDSVRVSPEAQGEARSHIASMWGKEYLPAKARNYRNRSASQDAHEAIRPTHPDMTPEAVRDSLTSDQYRLYKLIWNRFFASQMAEAVYDTVTADIGAGRHLFKANGTRLDFKGYLLIYKDEKNPDNTGNKADEKDEGENGAADDNANCMIPELIEDQELRLIKIDPGQHFTQPPARYTEATLVRAMEEKGIGRPSTYAPTISTILARGYVEKEKKSLLPSELGKIVTDIMKQNFPDIVDEKFTAGMENELDEIERGGKKWPEVIRDFYTDFARLVGEAEEKIGKVKIEDEPADIVCEKCGRDMVIKNGRFGKFIACPGFPECRNTKPILEEAGVNCPVCGGKVLIRKTKKGKPYISCENYTKCGFTSWDMPAKESCPVCGSFMLKSYRGRKPVLRCSNDKCISNEDSAGKPEAGAHKEIKAKKKSEKAVKK
ncbi:MAG: type I DNA topoisomerase [Eubacteriales bacterium]|nr:type I DNA topoisomerase [Eubacteriales bacterium]